MRTTLRKLLKGIRDPRTALQVAFNHGSPRYIKGERVYFNHGGQAGGAETPAELSARNFYELTQLKQVCKSEVITGEKVLEVGCGYGRVTPWFGKFTDASQVIGIDHNERSIRLAKREYPADRYSWLVGGAENADESFGAGSIDVVLTWTVLQHLSPKLATKTATSIQRILDQNGYLIIVEETESDDADHVWGRSPSEYDALFGGLDRIVTEKRSLEPTYGGYSEGGHLMVYKFS
jgi:SAM-dependent methyltransferase